MESSTKFFSDPFNEDEVVPNETLEDLEFVSNYVDFFLFISLILD